MVIAAIIGYLLGSIPTAVIVGRKFGFDPRNIGDRNPGWWNMRRIAGSRVAMPVLVGDLAKGAAAAAAGGLLWGPWWTAFVALLFALIGHSFPIFAKFQGGRGVVPFIGGMLVLMTVPTAIAIGIGAIVGLIARRFVLAVRVGVVALPLVAAYFEPFTHVAWVLVFVGFIGLRFASSRMAMTTTSGVAVPAR